MNLDKILEMYKTLPELTPSMMEESGIKYASENLKLILYMNKVARREVIDNYIRILLVTTRDDYVVSLIHQMCKIIICYSSDSEMSAVRVLQHQLIGIPENNYAFTFTHVQGLLGVNNDSTFRKDY